MPAAVTPEFGKGIRLFDGDVLRLERKYGMTTEVLAAALEGGLIRLTVTGTGRSEGAAEAYVRFCFECPYGVFVSTVRGYDLPGGVDDIAKPAHKRLTLMRRDLQSFVFTPAGSAIEAARDLAENGLLIQAQEVEEGDERGNARVRILATSSWNVVRSEIIGRPRRERQAPVPEAPQVAALSAFQRAAEELLPDSMLEAVWSRARELTGRRC